jgi:hypothetical protein
MGFVPSMAEFALGCDDDTFISAPTCIAGMSSHQRNCIRLCAMEFATHCD